jgi:hypothetical protein
MRETFAKEAANYDRASFETARTQAIQNTLATAQASQTWQGRAEIRDAALAGPLVSVLGASVGKSELGLTTIDVSIANVGLVAPAGSVRIQARSLSADLIVDDRSLVAGELPAQSRIKLEQVVLIQKSEASTNRGPLAVELSITLPNGKIVVQKVTL